MATRRNKRAASAGKVARIKAVRPPIPPRDQKMLWGAASARCSFPKCGRSLVADRSAIEGEVLLGEMAHIIASSTSGPRGEYTISEDERNRYRNLILLCEVHHKIVDSQRATYPPDTLHKFKAEHEERCQQPFGSPLMTPTPLVKFVSEQVYSTLLPVFEMPKRVYSAETMMEKENDLKRESLELLGHRPPAFIIREGRVWSFDDLGDDAGPFARWVRPHTCQPLFSTGMWDDPDQSRYFVALLNGVIRKIAGKCGLQLLDGIGQHFTFYPGLDGADVSKEYQPLNQAKSERKVAWQPVWKKTAQKKGYWEHLAVGLKFHQVSASSWVLAVRPEHHFTKDGKTPLTSRGTTSRSTKKASHQYNSDVLEDANFWRSYLSEGKPRIIHRFGTQSLIIDARLFDAQISWPGVPDDAKGYGNAMPEDDLFSYAELKAAMPDDDDDDDGDESPESHEGETDGDE